MLDSEEELRAELHAFLVDEQDLATSLPRWQALQNRVRDLAPSLSHDTLQLAHDVAYAVASVAKVLINVTEYSQQFINKMQDESERSVEREFNFKMEYVEYEEALSEDDDEPDTNWEALRDWFLAHLAQPFPTPSQCRRLVKEYHIDSEELKDWLERMRELTQWNDLFSSWAQSDHHVMKELMKLVQKEIDLGIPEHRCRTSSIQRVEVERLRQVVHKVYKHGSEWCAQFDALFDSDGEEDGTKEDEDYLSGEESIWPPSDDDDARELTAVDPDYGLATFFDADEQPITAPIRPTNSPPISTTFANVPKVLSPRSALQREGLEWLDKLERIEAEADTAYAEMERIAIKLENSDDKSVAVKLEAAEIRFEEAQQKEKEMATEAIQRVRALQAQVKRGQPIIKKEYIEPTIFNNEPTFKSEIVEVLVPTVKVEVDTKFDAVDPDVSPAKEVIEASVEITFEPLVNPEPSNPEPSNPELEAENDAKPGVVEKTELDSQVQVDEREILAGSVKEVPKTKGGPNSPLHLSNKSELETVIFGTFQPLEPEEIEELVISFAPLSATIVQLDPTAIIVPPGLIDLSKSGAYAQANEEQQFVVKTEPVEVGLNEELATVSISCSLEEVVSLPANSSMLPQVQIVLDPPTPPTHPAPKTSIRPPLPATSRCIRGMPRRTAPRLAAGTPPRFTSTSSTSSASGSYSGSSACSSDSEIGGDTTPISSPIAKHSRLRPPSKRTKAPPSQSSPSQRKRKRGCEEEPLQYNPSDLLASRPMKRAKGSKRDSEEAHATLRAEFVPPPLPKVSVVSESRKTKRKRCEEEEEEEEEPRVIKRTRTQEDHLERPCHSMVALVLDPALAPQPSPKLDNVSGLPVVKSTSMSLEEIEKMLRVSDEDAPHPTVEEIKNLSLEALALMTDQEFSALICSPESWELKYLEYESNEELFEDSLPLPPTPTKVLIAPPSPPMSAVVALPPAKDVARGPQLEVENLAEPIPAALTDEMTVKQTPIEPALGLVLAPVLPSAAQTMPEPIPDAPQLAASASNTRDRIRYGTLSLPANYLATRPQSPEPAPPPLARRTRTKRAVGMMDTLSISGKRVTPALNAHSRGPVRVVQLRGGKGRLEEGARNLVLPISVRPKR